jgi:hypothetical protein
LVSREWKELIDSESFWCRLLKRDFPGFEHLECKNAYIKLSEHRRDNMNIKTYSFVLKVLREMLTEAINLENTSYGFSGESDSNQTDFEEMSNNWEICVFCPKKYESVCLRILRYYTDDNWELIDWDYYTELEYVDDHSQTPDMRQYFNKSETEYLTTAPNLYEIVDNEDEVKIYTPKMLLEILNNKFEFI